MLQLVGNVHHLHRVPDHGDIVGGTSSRLPSNPVLHFAAEPGMRRPGGTCRHIWPTASFHCYCREHHDHALLWRKNSVTPLATFHPPSYIRPQRPNQRSFPPPCTCPTTDSTMQDNPRGFNAELLRLCEVAVDPAAADAAYAATQDAVAKMAAAAAAEEAEG